VGAAGWGGCVWIFCLTHTKIYDLCVLDCNHWQNSKVDRTTGEIWPESETLLLRNGRWGFLF
jgi:hypothetical protein